MTFAKHTDTSVYHANAIAGICQVTGCEKYLELGTQYGWTISVISEVVPYCVGVDLNPCSFNGTMVVGTTDEFFARNDETFDVIFIDADHSYESVVKDFNNSLKILNKHGIIFLHDTDPVNEEFTHPGLCNDCYKIVDYIRDTYPELDIVTLPAREAGLSIVSRKEDRRVLNFGMPTCQKQLGMVVLSKYDDYLDTFMLSLNEKEPRWRDIVDLVIGSDGLRESTKDRYRNDGAIVLDMPKPFNYARNINMCVRQLRTTADFLLINDDVRFVSDYPILTLLSVLGDVRKRPQKYATVCLSVASGEVGNQGQYCDVIKTKETIPIMGNVAFVATTILRGAWNEVGTLDERFVGYGYEDDDWCRRAINAGYIMGVTGSVNIHHGMDGHKSSSSWKRSQIDLSVASVISKNAYMQKWPDGKLNKPL